MRACVRVCVCVCVCVSVTACEPEVGGRSRWWWTCLELLLSGFFKQLLLLSQQFLLWDAQPVQTTLSSLSVLLMRTKTKKSIYMCKGTRKAQSIECLYINSGKNLLS